MARTLSTEEKDSLANQVKLFLAEECEKDIAEIKDETDIIEELGADSLLFLELIQDLQEEHDIEMDLRSIGKYIVKNPVKTVGEAIQTMYNIIEKGEELLEEGK